MCRSALNVKLLAIATLVRELAGGVLSFAAVLGDCAGFVLEPADGVLSYAANTVLLE